MFEAIGELEAACARHAALRMTEADRAQLRELHARGRAAMQAGIWTVMMRQILNCIPRSSKAVIIRY